VKHYLEIGAIHVTPKPFDAMTLPGEITKTWERFHGHT